MTSFSPVTSAGTEGSWKENVPSVSSTAASAGASTPVSSGGLARASPPQRTIQKLRRE